MGVLVVRVPRRLPGMERAGLIFVLGFGFGFFAGMGLALYAIWSTR